MHDVLAHRLSLIALHAGALEYRAGLDPAATSATAGVVRDAARSALTELREVLGMLREPTGVDGAEADVRVAPPQPTLADLDDLLLDAREGPARTSSCRDSTTPSASPWPTCRRPRWPPRLPHPAGVPDQRPEARARSPRLGRRVGAPRARAAAPRSRTRSPTGPRPRRSRPADTASSGLAERARLAGGSAVVVHDEARHRVEARLPWPA